MIHRIPSDTTYGISKMAYDDVTIGIIAFISLVTGFLLNEALRGTAKSPGRWKGKDRRKKARLYSVEPATPQRPSHVSRPLINYSEKEFFTTMLKALPEHYIFTQVSFNALITHAPHVWSQEAIRNVRMKFNARYVDFVICDQQMDVVAVVEYDGSGHNSRHDKWRDKMLKDAGYRVERFTTGSTGDVVRSRLLGAAEKPSGIPDTGNP